MHFVMGAYYANRCAVTIVPRLSMHEGAYGNECSTWRRAGVVTSAQNHSIDERHGGPSASHLQEEWSDWTADKEVKALE